ncbi:MAG: monovalent cation/H+ antiporter subunit D family protein [Propionibacteriaceae bacterium]|nr:monovalent cation/H+ antiporter subunit D family protein [Propionibacteriaceae bacterium]
MIAAPMLPLFVAGPLLIGGVLIALHRHRRLSQAILLLTLAATLAGAAALVATLSDGAVLAHRVGGWDPPLAIVFAADLIGALLMTAASLLTLVTCWFGITGRQADRAYFAPMVLILTGGVNGALLTGDLFNLFVFIEVMLLPSYALIVMGNRGRGRLMQVTSSRIYVTVNLLTSTILLAGVGLVYAVTGTVTLADLAGAGNDSATVAIVAGVVLFALSIKAAVFPVHGWLPRTYPFMTPTVTALFSGLHTKVAIVALYRLGSVLFDGAPPALWVAVVVCCLTMVFGVLGAVGETDGRGVLAFHMISQIGYILLGLALFTPLGLAAGIFYLLHHVFVKASLFLCVGAVELVHGRRPLGEVTGMLRREPLLAGAFFVAAASLAGLPPFSGFVAKLTLIVAALDAGQIIAAVVAIAVSLFTLLSMLKIWGAMFLGEPSPLPASVADEETVPAEPADEGEEQGAVTRGVPTLTRTPDHAPDRIPLGLILPGAALALVTLALGLGAEGLFLLAEAAASTLLDPAVYVEAVRAS